MSRRTFTPQTKQEEPVLYRQRPLPVEEWCALYTRQSTAKQVVDNPESAEMQTIGLMQKIRALGWSEDKIIVYIENKREDGTIRSASGRLRIDERPGLSAIMERIYSGEVKAVFAYNEARLFRDEWNIQVDTFVKACYDHDVRVVTQFYTYDFRAMTYDMDQFRMQCKISADFIKGHVFGVLHPAKKQAALRGQYFGGVVPIGFIIDYEKGPMYKHYIPYEPHAEILREVFKRYRELDGKFYALYRELRKKTIFPLFTGIDHVPHIGLQKRADGYGIGRWGLLSILTNPAYIGLWIVRETDKETKEKKVIAMIHDNHAAIVDEDDFWYAFNRLSSMTLDGEEQQDVPLEPIRYSQENKPEPIALLKDVITSPDGPVYVKARGRGEFWDYGVEGPPGDERLFGSIRSVILDRIFTDRMMEWLNVFKLFCTMSGESGEGKQDFADVRELENKMQEKLCELQAQGESSFVSVDEQIERTRKRIAQVERDKRIASEEDDEHEVRECIRALKDLRAALASLEVKKRDAETRQAEVQECRGLLDEAIANWYGMSFERQKRFIRLVTDKVAIQVVAPHWMKLEIVWTGVVTQSGETVPFTDTGYIFRSKGNLPIWTEDELNVIRESYVDGKRDDLLHRLPLRSWTGIRSKAEELRIARRIYNQTASIPNPLSVQDVEFMTGCGIPTDQHWYDKAVYWLPSPWENSQIISRSKLPTS